ncbi:sterol desaturase family protein [Pseudenhygromyxa sp. WMMC2535]|uniref:sterol desaturase family protein n=1 Tax=Pseudenhygromyxa sp. WMMC2535 TaxID=2712867 RepID=UPI001552FE4C|nr:sterol desaturase family protein [Pseudenhygromyxa sp. WMMC2535]NVB42743.1 sterol desaturase family protein [Pseudenhygromyxa sp. WMMC2535]
MSRAAPRYARDRDLSLAQAFAIFSRELPPKFLFAHLFAWLGYRLWLLGQGDVGLADLIPLIAIPLAHPFVEWLIHVFVLHHRPRRLFAGLLGEHGLRWDYHAARYHRLHHRDPWDLRFVLMPLPAMIFGLSSAAAGIWLIAPRPGVLATAMIVVASAALYYEWIHFLVHTSYRPQGWFYRRQWRFHRLHHYKNERYWMGVTRHLGDVVLGTMPAPESVESSKTARTLGLEGSLGER